ncbi:hypothetical protein [Haladaptatus sp. NG-SE-30]
MSRVQFDVTTVVKLFASLLLVVALVSVVGLVSESGVTGLLQGITLLYIAVVLFVGVFRDVTRTRRWRVAFFGGVVVWSIADYLFGGRDEFSLLLGLAGLVMLVGIGYDYLQTRE